MRYEVRKHPLNKSPTQDQFKEKILKRRVIGYCVPLIPATVPLALSVVDCTS